MGTDPTEQLILLAFRQVAPNASPVDDERHEDDRLLALGIVDAVAGAIGGPGRVPCLDGALHAVVVVDCLAGEDKVALAVAVVLVIAEHRTGRNRHTGVESALIGKLLVQNLLNQNLANPVGARPRACRFHDENYTIFALIR